MDIRVCHQQLLMYDELKVCFDVLIRVEAPIIDLLRDFVPSLEKYKVV